MAYFPNGTSGMIFAAENCDHCSQWKEREGYLGVGEGCPIYDVHLLYQGDSDAGPQMPELLGMLITDTKEGPVCQMFTPENANSALEAAGQLRLVDSDATGRIDNGTDSV